MVICLIGQERNLGLLTLTDYLLNKLGKLNCAVVGWNYLIEDNSPILKKIKEFQNINKNIIIKYVTSKYKFSFNQDIIFPEIIEEISDVIFRVPSYREEISALVPKIFLKGKGNPVEKYFDEFYATP